MNFLENTVKAVVATVICRVMVSKNKSGEIRELAVKLDEIADKKFGDKSSEKIQRSAIYNFFFPFCKELMHEDLGSYVSMLRQEAKEIEDGLQGKKP